MAISRVEIKDFLVFQGDFAVDFCPGVNVLIGGNGTGKTTLLKVMYEQFTKEKLEILQDTVTDDNIVIVESTTNERILGGTTNDKNSEKKFYSIEGSIKGVAYIPVAEMLSHSKGLLELNSKYQLPFDNTQINILINAGLPITREIMPNAKKVIGKVSEIIDGEVLYEDREYYIIKNSGLKVPYSLEASGFQKFGLLWKLLRNGLLEKGTVLFWDEPEASINPGLISVLVDILLELQRGGVQIFIGTHSEILASYFAVNRKTDNEVMFYSLYKDGEQIKYDKSDRFDLLTPNTLTAEPVKLYEKEIEGWLGNG